MEANAAIQVNAMIDHIADKLAVPSAKLMELLPALGIRDAIIGGVALAGWLLFAVTVVRVVRSALRKQDEDFIFCVTLLGGIPLLAVSPFVLGKVGDLVLWFYNPEAWAVRYVFKKLF